MSWLSDTELEQAIRRYGDVNVNHAFQGVFPMDQLPRKVNPPAFFIVNTDVHNLHGKHWFVLFINEDLSGEIFDSLACSISNYCIRFLNHHTRHWTFNRIAYQHPRSTSCGVFVLYYVTQ